MTEISRDSLDVGGELSGIVGPAVARIMTRRGGGSASVDYLRQAAQQSRDEVLQDLVRNFNPNWAHAFAQVHKVVDHPLGNRPLIVPRVGDLTVKPIVEYGPDGVRAYDKSRDVAARMRARGARRGRDKKQKTYRLADLLFDHNVSSKLHLNDADLQLLRRAAVLEPASACRSMEAQFRAQGFDCVVVPGDYLQGVKACRAALHRALEACNATPPHVTVEFIGQEAICEGPLGADGHSEWSVTGPASCSPEVAVVARLATLQGAHTVRTLFESELVTCNVTLVENFATIEGFEYHIGGPNDYLGISGSDGYQHSESVRAAAERVMPLSVGGRVVATAVRYNETEAFANWHVIDHSSEETKITVGLPGEIPSSPVQTSHEVGADVWVISHPAADFGIGAWVQREADVLETAVLVYATRVGVEFSDTVTVQRVERGSIVTSRPPQARPGISGAALVSTADGALLGIYRGAAMDVCSCAVVACSSEGYGSSEALVVGRAALDGVQTPADSAFQAFQDRGLVPVLVRALASMQQLYEDGRLVGYAVRHGYASYTTLDCDVWNLTDSAGRHLPFKRVQGDKFSCDASLEQVPLGLVRLARPHERVHIVGKDADGVYMSVSMYVARLGSDGHSFWLSADPAQGSQSSFVYEGALVVAESDAAVVGQFVVANSTGAGRMSKCVGLVPRSLDKPLESDRILNSMAEDVMVELWDRGVVEALVTRDPEVITRYSQVGAVALQSAILVQNARDSDGAGQAVAAAVVSDSNWLLSRAIDCGFLGAIKPVSGSLVRPAERVADCFRAFFGMLATFQGQHAVESALRQLRWYEFVWSEEWSRIAGGTLAPQRTSMYGSVTSAFSRTSSPSPHSSPVV